MEPVIEGGVQVASPPYSAGRPGRVQSHDWDAIVAMVRQRCGEALAGGHPLPWFWYSGVAEGTLDDLRKRYDDVEFLGHQVHDQVAWRGTRRVCDVYVSLFVI